MIGSALVVGFFTAIGWFSAQKLMTNVTEPKPPIQIEQNINKEKK